MKKSIRISLFILFMFALTSAKANYLSETLISYISSRALALEQSSDLDALIAGAADRKLVLLGEASHGTREYYAWRDSISRRLIAEHGFNFIAVEGDWASLYELNLYVKDMPGAAGSAREVLEGLDRWPLWMWGNEEVVALAEWMRSFNSTLPEEERVGFYGKDVYDEWNSYRTLLSFLQTHNQEVYRKVQAQYACFAPYADNSWQYAQAVAGGMNDCTRQLAEAVETVRRHKNSFTSLSDSEYFWLLQNALVVKHAEKFYRKSITRQDASSWNSRVQYMNMTVNRLLGLYGPDSRGIVWAHNTHIGDARFTEMGQFGQKNIGHLSRVEHGPEQVFLVGFATYRGAVMAGDQWGSRMQIMRVPAAPSNSIEGVLERTGLERFYLVFDDDDRTHREFMEVKGNRAIGVVYNPQNDRRQYVQTIVPLRYDALLFFRETEALTPLHK
ncbi:MAG: erythromycin esterase family protein [Bacteroidales bacterium]|nr:erythromycin esterase family protein [Bacteroidales bacterium]